MQSRNPNSNGSRHGLTNDEVDVSQHQEETPSEQISLSTMHPHSYLNYSPHSQMMGTTQVVQTPHGIENQFQV